MQVLHKTTREVLFTSEASSLERADLTAGDFHGALLDHMNLKGALLTGAGLIGAGLAEAQLDSAHLRGANLRGACLRGASLRGANLVGVDLRGSDLSGADLTGADLTGADLLGANLANACLDEADLTGASLESAVLEGADLRKAVLTDTTLVWSLCDPRTRWPEGVDAVRRGAILLSPRKALARPVPELRLAEPAAAPAIATPAEEAPRPLTRALAG